MTKNPKSEIANPQSPDTRLIERWLPIAELGEESVRERRSMTSLPPTYYLHVWWARRPLVASRAAILASLLPADANKEKFKHLLGIHGDPIKTKGQIFAAKKTGADLGADPYGYQRAFKYLPDDKELAWLKENLPGSVKGLAKIIDPTAGGGSIPYEAIRLGQEAFANDLNPVAALILRGTVYYPAKLGSSLLPEFEQLSEKFLVRIQEKLKGMYNPEPEGTKVLSYLWARTIKCPYCDGLVPLSPNWRLSKDGLGVRITPHCSSGPNSMGRRCDFEIVSKTSDQSAPTATDGDATCPFPDCARVIEGDEIKRQGLDGNLGEQLYAIAFKRKTETKNSAGKKSFKWIRGFRTPTLQDETGSFVSERLASKLPEWEAEDINPTEAYPEMFSDRVRAYGVRYWRDLFSSRQYLCHCFGVETYRELLTEELKKGKLPEIRVATFVYLALSLDKFIDYNSRLVTWHANREVMDHTFRQHAFAVKWSHAEMPPAITGQGYEWVLGQTAKCIGELIELVRPPEAQSADMHELSFSEKPWTPPPITVTCKSGDSLEHLKDSTIDAVVMDPPYYDNVMYAELSDFFYVWLKRTAGQLLPELFRRTLTDKESEAVANPAKFKEQKGAKVLAGRDYQERMAAIFAECRRVLKPDGIMTLMFTHKATGAWDALTAGLMHAGFTITASWPINTESESSLHIKDKAAANSTIFLACRPRAVMPSDAETQYWEDVEPLVAGAVRKRVGEFQAAGIRSAISPLAFSSRLPSTLYAGSRIISP
ncbi:MAG: DUF1156 domain-containing protein [Verrucomicrobiota bacterium]